MPIEHVDIPEEERHPPRTHAASHASGGVDPVTPAAIGAVPTSRSVATGAGLSGGGDLSADRTLAVSFGAASGTACEGNDARLSDARTPTSHAASHVPGAADALATAAPVAVGTANTEGAAASYARSDHAHDGSHLLPRDGSRAMTAALDMGGQNLSNLGAILAEAQAVAYAASVGLDVDASNDFQIAELTGGITIGFTNAADGRQGMVAVKQDGVGAHAITWDGGTRTLLKDDAVTDLQPKQAADAITLYAYAMFSYGGTGYVYLAKVELGAA